MDAGAIRKSGPRADVKSPHTVSLIGVIWVLMLSAFVVLPSGLPKAVAGDDVRKVRTSKHLQLASPAALDAALAGSLPDEFEVRLDDGLGTRRTVRTCADFLEITDKPFDTDSEQDWQLIWIQGLRCIALKLIKSAHPAKTSLIDNFHLSAKVAATLPPQLGLPIAREEIERVKQAAAACRSLKAYDPSTQASTRSEDAIALRGKIWEADVFEYARGDFDGDGFEDVLLRRDGGMRKGTYHRTNLFILTRTPNDKCLRIIREIP